MAGGMAGGAEEAGPHSPHSGQTLLARRRVLESRSFSQYLWLTLPRAYEVQGPQPASKTSLLARHLGSG